jgi:alkylation response protein AidB-like acyl-CoA dehydrogenase
LDFELNEDQRAILDAAEQLLAERAGPARAIALQQSGEYDDALDAALFEAGFSDVARGAETGDLEAALIVEAVARAGGLTAIGAQALVAPALRREAFAHPIALLEEDADGPVRFAAHACSLLVLGADEARWVRVPPGACSPVRSNFGYPMGRVPEALRAGGEGLGAGSAARMRARWRLALAAEMVGTMDAALAQTVDYLKQRRQFGHTIASFQAVQHRLAECAIQLEASRWLMREAAHHGAPGERVATAAAFAAAAARQVFGETHQLSGAIGFTREHDLHVFSMRLQALRLELGGVAAHRRAIVMARWRGADGGAAR